MPESGTQASCYNLQGVVDDRVNEADTVTTAVPDRSAVYSAAEWTRAVLAVRSVVASTPRPEPASCLTSASHDVNFLRNDLRCRRYVRTCPTVLRGIWSRSKNQGFVFVVDV